MKVADVIRVIKDADVMTPYKVDLRVSVVEKSRDERSVQRAENDTVTSTMLAVPCWWSWKTAMLMQSGC